MAPEFGTSPKDSKVNHDDKTLIASLSRNAEDSNSICNLTNLTIVIWDDKPWFEVNKYLIVSLLLMNLTLCLIADTTVRFVYGIFLGSISFKNIQGINLSSEAFE